jgi:hypothetical protein
MVASQYGVMVLSDPLTNAVAVEPPAGAPRLARTGGDAAAPAVTLPAQALPLPADLLDGGEIIILAIKPSPWFVLFDSTRWLIVAAFLVATSEWLTTGVGPVSQTMLVQVAVLLAAGRLTAALLRWATRHYILTNRRIIRIGGVLRPDIYVCPLLRIQNTRVSEALHEKLAGCGTLHFGLTDLAAPDADWYVIAHPHEVHDRVRRAIERMIDCQPHA